MISFGLKTIVTSLFILATLFIIDNATANEVVAPDRNISVVHSDPEIPQWKSLWDEARKHARSADFHKAALLYGQLFNLKPTIEEANWEYCKVLLKTQDFETAGNIIEGLIEANPNRVDYLVAKGTVSLSKQDYSGAIELFGRVFEQEPASENGDKALRGLVESLQGKGRKEFSFSLLRQLVLRNPDDKELVYSLARDAASLGYEDISVHYYKELLAHEEVDDRIIFQAAELFAESKRDAEAAELWQRYLDNNPGYHVFRQKLAEYQLRNGLTDQAAKNIAYLAEYAEDRGEYQLRAGDLYLLSLNRPDKALVFYEAFLKNNADNAEIKQKVLNIQSILASDFLSIVENDGAWLLWKDLSRLAPNRLAIYEEMADILERKGKDKELAEILTILHKQSPQDDVVSYRLGNLYFRTKKYKKSLSYLRNISNNNRKKSFYELRCKVEGALGLESESLSSKLLVLKEDPADLQLREECLRLAVRLGEFDVQQKLLAGLNKSKSPGISTELIYTHLDFLVANSLQGEFETFYRWASDSLAGNTKEQFQLELQKVNSLRAAGKKLQAEQILRQRLAQGVYVFDVLYELTANSIEDKVGGDAEKWFDALKNERQEVEPEQRLQRKEKQLLLHSFLLEMKGDYEEAVQEIQSYVAAQRGNGDQNGLPPVLAKQLCKLTFLAEDYENAKGYCFTLQKSQFDPDLFVLQKFLLARVKDSQGLKKLEKQLFRQSTPLISRLLAVAEKELNYQDYAAAEKHLFTIPEKFRQSVVFHRLLAELYLKTGRLEKARTEYELLLTSFPLEPYFLNKKIEIEMRLGNYGEGLELLTKNFKGEIKNYLEVADTFLSTGKEEELVLLARLLWGNKQLKTALDVYEKILNPSAVEIVGQDFRQKQIDYLYLTHSQSFWSSLGFLLQSEPEVIAELMEIDFLLDNIGKDSGTIVSDRFAIYNLQQLVENEYLARKAIYERKYQWAERSYRKLIEEDGSQEQLIDLAAIYGRTGEYRKEAQVYEKIQARGGGTPSPALMEQMARNTRQLSPTSTLDTRYDKKEGREGAVDIEKTSLGTSFWFTPDLNKDVLFGYANNSYEDTEGDNKLSSNSIIGSATIEFGNNYSLVVDAETEKFNGKSGAEFYYGGKISTRLDDYFRAYGLVERRPVYDTILAIEERIYYDGFEAGLLCETPMGITFGGDVRYNDYSDNNSGKVFHGFANYHLFWESVRFDLRYDYQKVKNDEENPLTQEPHNAPPESSVFYWSPLSYGEHRLKASVRHDFLGYEEGNRKGESYYTVDIGVNLEDEEEVGYFTDIHIFLEMSPHFLLKTSFNFGTSDVYEETGFGLNLHYRW